MIPGKDETMGNTRSRLRAGLLCTGAALAFFAADASACVPTALPMGVKGPGLCYGAEVWPEPTLGGRTLEQQFDFYRAPSTAPTSLIVWAHPNGMSKALPEDSPMYQALVVPALRAGFSFASIEFRHPVTNEALPNSDSDPRVPHYDLAYALQFIRANAEALNIDKRNVFLVGQSRGTLAVWTALQDDMRDPDSPDPVARQSTRVNAVYAVNAQTTYSGAEFARRFLIQDDRARFTAAFNRQHPKHEQFGSAIGSVNAGVKPDPPVRLIYDSQEVGRLLSLQEMNQHDPIHYPDFGPALCGAYAKAFGSSAYCTYDADPRYQGDPMAAYAGYVDFFKRYVRTSTSSP
ncbi:alpha/beta hydrolase [Lysobacter sp. CA196]|uniref:alpha/beta hydrolase n=1 Tax=Lysobacter sp. CA196 TaxID=3455606 RepID=UPI003F8D15C9